MALTLQRNPSAYEMVSQGDLGPAQDVSRFFGATATLLHNVNVRADSRAATLHRAELLRVSVEGLGGGNVGFVEITADTTLTQLRTLIERNLDVDIVPRFYQFVKPDGMLVGSAKERSTLASGFLPCVTLMPTQESPLAGERPARPRR